MTEKSLTIYYVKPDRKSRLKLPGMFVIHSSDIINPERTVFYDNGNFENIRNCTAEQVILVFTTLIIL